ncbi:MAG: hypothetical protein EXS46_01805 [Candidatus Taylorbacteria bacterium]|nr:hypothetical protein [Candidatus Taylorbacteria bacterium]
MKENLVIALIVALSISFTAWLTDWLIASVSLAIGVLIVGVVFGRTKFSKIISKIKTTKLVELLKKAFTLFKTQVSKGDREYGFYLSPLSSTILCLSGIFVIFSTFAVLIYLIVGKWKVEFKVETTDYSIQWLPFIFISAILYIAGSFKKVSETENAVKSFFGIMFEDLGPGPAFVPRWLCKITPITSNIITLAGGTPEKVKAAERGEGHGTGTSEQVVEWKLVQNEEEFRGASGTIRVSEEATRVTFASGISAKFLKKNDVDDSNDELTFRNSTNPLSAKITTDPKIVVSLLIPKSGIRILIRRFGDLISALRKIDELMMSHLQILCSRITLEYFIYRIDDVALTLHYILETLLEEDRKIDPTRPEVFRKAIGFGFENIKSLGRTGIDVKSVRIETGLPKGINLAMKEATIEAINVERATSQAASARVLLVKKGEGTAIATQALMLAEAEGVRATRLAEAEGTRAEQMALAEGRQAFLNAEAKGRKAIIKASDSEMGRLLAQLEMVEKALKDNSKIVITPAGADGNLLSGLINIKETLKSLDTTKTPQTPTI